MWRSRCRFLVPKPFIDAGSWKRIRTSFASSVVRCLPSSTASDGSAPLLASAMAASCVAAIVSVSTGSVSMSQWSIWEARHCCTEHHKPCSDAPPSFALTMAAHPHAFAVSLSRCSLTNCLDPMGTPEQRTPSVTLKSSAYTVPSTVPTPPALPTRSLMLLVGMHSDVASHLGLVSSDPSTPIVDSNVATAANTCAGSPTAYTSSMTDLAAPPAVVNASSSATSAGWIAAQNAAETGGLPCCPPSSESKSARVFASPRYTLERWYIDAYSSWYRCLRLGFRSTASNIAFLCISLYAFFKSNRTTMKLGLRRSNSLTAVTMSPAPPRTPRPTCCGQKKSRYASACARTTAFSINRRRRSPMPTGRPSGSSVSSVSSASSSSSAVALRTSAYRTEPHHVVL